MTIEDLHLALDLFADMIIVGSASWWLFGRSAKKENREVTEDTKTKTNRTMWG